MINPISNKEASICINKFMQKNEKQRTNVNQEKELRKKIAIKLKEEGNVYYRNMLFFHAIRCYERTERFLDKADAELINIYNNLALCYFQIRAYDEAISFCDKVLALDPFNVKSFKKRSDCYIRKVNLELGLLNILICALISKNVNDVVFFKNIASQYMKLLTLTEIEKNISKPLKKLIKDETEYIIRSFNNFEYTEFPKDKYFNENKDKIFRILKTKNYEELNQLLDIGSGEFYTFLRGIMAFVYRDYVKAEKILCNENFKYSIVLYEFMTFYNHKNHKLSSKFENCLKKNFDDAVVLYYASLIYRSMNDSKNCIKYLNMALKCKNVFVHVYEHKFFVHLKEDNTLAASTTFGEAYPKYPDDPIFLSFMVNFFIKTKSTIDLIPPLHKMEQSKSKNPKVLVLRANIKFFLGEYEEAERLYKESMSIDDTYNQSYAGYANCLNLKNDPNCRKYYEKAIQFSYCANNCIDSVENLIVLDLQKIIDESYPHVKRKINDLNIIGKEILF